MTSWATREGSNLRQAGAVVDFGGTLGKAMVAAMVQVDASGNALGQSYQLATVLASLASGANTGDTSNIAGGTYIWDSVLSGTSPSLVLEALSSDGTTWVAVATVTATGRLGVVLGTNARVRLRNGSGSNAITNLSSSLT